MSELIYAKIDLTKKVRFQRGEKTEEEEKEEEERRNADVCDNIDNVVIYDNCWTEESTAPPKPPDKTTDDQQKTASVSLSPVKRTLPRAAGLFLGLLCLVLLAAVIILLVLWIQDKSKCAVEKDNWTMERNRLWVDMTNLASEKDRLENYSYRVMESYNETKSINYNLTQQIGQLENEKNLLKTVNNNLTTERDELLKRIETSCCPANWINYRWSCYFMSPTKKNWSDSKRFCEDQSAHLVIISNTEEQKFISSFDQEVWIGLTDAEKEGVWKWVDGTQVTKTYWRKGQPDNPYPGEDCVVIIKDVYTNNWNDLFCTRKNHFICEMNL